MPPDPANGPIVVISRNSRPQPTCNVTQRWTGHVLLLEALTLICGSSFRVPRVSRLQPKAGVWGLTGGALRPKRILPRRQVFLIIHYNAYLLPYGDCNLIAGYSAYLIRSRGRPGITRPDTGLIPTS